MYYTFTNQTLTFVLEGAEQVAALRAKVTVEKSTITDITFHEVFSDWHGMMVRLPGSYMPRFIMAGSYWTEEGWDFVYAHKPRGLRVPIVHNVLVISTTKDRYKRLILETSSENAQEIIAWWHEKRAA